jgi:hypothetical protein
MFCSWHVSPHDGLNDQWPFPKGLRVPWSSNSSKGSGLGGLTHHKQELDRRSGRPPWACWSEAEANLAGPNRGATHESDGLGAHGGVASRRSTRETATVKETEEALIRGRPGERGR